MPARRRRCRPPIAAAAAALVLAAAAAPPATAAAATTITDGTTRFEVLSPSLVRVQHAADGRFEDRPTLTTEGRLRSAPKVRTAVRGGDRIIRTSRLRLRWRRGSGPLDPGDLTVRLRDGTLLRPRPGANPAPLGGWRRSLDLTDGPVALHEGVLSRTGWYLLDDTSTALIEGETAMPRPGRAGRDGAYEDLYLFAYGDDHARALRDLRTLTGPTPLLPRKAFGVWFSRWWPYGDADWRTIVQRFRDERVPLDTISIDTDFKRVHDPAGSAVAAAASGAPGLPYSWNGWDWNRELYPDPAGFLRWARDAGLEVGLNVHPSISTSDPRYAETERRAGAPLASDPGCLVLQADTRGECRVFDWGDPRQLEAFFALHESFERDGVGFWWLDWCCDGSRLDVPGLTPDTWINRAYTRRQRARGSRWPSFQRIGGSFQAGFGGKVGVGAFAEHRHALQFTGDTCANWRQLGFASEFTAAAGSIGMAYVSHDVGTFHGQTPGAVCNALSPFISPQRPALDPELYVRWMQLGTFQPLDRLHSHHGFRLPWEYPGKAGRTAADFLRLREALVPHLYALAREAHDTGMPMVRALYLQWPGLDEAYEHPEQYTLGDDLLVAPVARPGDPAEVRVWFPPGTWQDIFTGERHRGPATKTLSVPLERMPVFARAGSVLALQPPVPTTSAAPHPTLELHVRRGSGATTIYEDAGEGLAYDDGEHATTRVSQHRARGATVVRIGARRGRFTGLPRRTYDIRVIDVDRPREVTVAGRRVRATYDPAPRTATFTTGRVRTDRDTRIVVRWAGSSRSR